MTDDDRLSAVPGVMQRWAAAESSGDVTALRELLADDFTGIGPHGFVLDKQHWLARYRDGDLLNDAFAVEETGLRSYGITAVAVGVQTQQGSYRGYQIGGTFRLTIVLVDRNQAWSIAHVQLSNMASE